MPTQYGEDIAVLKDQMKDVKDGQVRMETKLDNVISNYATKTELKTFKWITLPLAIILTAAITWLVTFYLTNRISSVGQSPATSSSQTSSTSTTTSSPAQSTPGQSTQQPTPSTPTPSSSSGGLQVNVPKASL